VTLGRQACTNRLDDEDAVELVLDQFDGDFVLDRDEAELTARAEGEGLADTPVRDRGQEHGRVVRFAIRQHK